MGGSGSGGYTPTAPTSPCARLTFQAAINSPKSTVLRDLNVGEALDVVLNEEGHGVVIERNGLTAGSLIGTQVAQLVNCLNSGFEYQAIVVKINGGQFIVRVQAK